MLKASHLFNGTPGTPAVGERQTPSPDVVLAESVEILPLGITLQVIKQLAEEDGGTHAAVCRHCELPSGVLQGAPHLQNLFQTWKDTPFRQQSTGAKP